MPPGSHRKVIHWRLLCACRESIGFWTVTLRSETGSSAAIGGRLDAVTGADGTVGPDAGPASVVPASCRRTVLASAGPRRPQRRRAVRPCLDNNSVTTDRPHPTAGFADLRLHQMRPLSGAYVTKVIITHLHHLHLWYPRVSSALTCGDASAPRPADPSYHACPAR
jgi:hypothetical protein